MNRSKTDLVADSVNHWTRALFTLLQQVTSDMRELQGDELAGRAKYAELVMKVRSELSSRNEREHSSSYSHLL
jgi:hypothetical protein